MKNQNSLKWIIKNSKGEIPKIFILSISNTVSYTHLDVYKRQMLPHT